jgi:hypothetical protein
MQTAATVLHETSRHRFCLLREIRNIRELRQFQLVSSQPGRVADVAQRCSPEAGLTAQKFEAECSMLGWAANVAIAIKALPSHYAKLKSGV